MKKLLLRSKLAALICLLPFLSKAADPNVSIYIGNPQYVSANIYEFDIFIEAEAPTTSFELRTFQAGIYVNPAWVNGGTLTLQTAPGYSEMNGLGYNGNYLWNATDHLINCSVNTGVKTISSCISSVVDNQPFRVVRIRAVNSNSFGCVSPDLQFNYVLNNSPVRLRTTFTWRETGCSVNYGLHYPGRLYQGTASMNGENWTLADADGKSPANTAVNAGNCFPLLHLSAILQGYHIGGGNMQSVLTNQMVRYSSYIQTDTITVELRPDSDPSQVFYTGQTVLMADGNATLSLPAGALGQNYYLVIKHRNTLQTWSANPITIAQATTYDFTSSASQSFADNVAMVEPGHFALFTGDLNQDEFIDPFDFPIFDADNFAAVALDYYLTDLNGDGFVDPFDFPIYDANNFNAVFSLHP